MAAKRKLVVIGNGMAGARTVEEILERGGAELGMEAGEAVPGLVDDHLDAALVRRLDDRREVVAQAVIGAGRQDQGLGVRVLVDFPQ